MSTSISDTPAGAVTTTSRDDGRSHSFTRAQRLISKHDYAFVFAKAKKLHHAYFTLLYRPGQGTCTRLGLAVSRKAMRQAVKRNRFKRLLRESFRQHFSQQTGTWSVSKSTANRDLTSAPDQDTIAPRKDTVVLLDIVVIAKAAAAGASNQALRQAFDQTWPVLIAQ